MLKFLPICLLLALLLTIQVNVMAQDNTELAAKPRIELLGITTLPANEKDHSGLNESLTETTTNNLLGGFSAIAWSGNDDLYYFLSDRGPNDGAVNWTCRVQSIRLSVDTANSNSISTQLVGTTILRDARNIPYTGIASAFHETANSTVRLDPEGLRVTDNGNLIVSDEYGPLVIEFQADGKQVRQIPIPSRYQISHPGLDKKSENPANKSGRQCNRGMEGLALSANQETLFGLMQSPLIQDCDGTTNPVKPLGLNCRLLQFDRNGNADVEWIYHLEDSSNKLNEILRCSDSTFAVIERDGLVGHEAKFKKIMLVSNFKADNVQDIDCLPAIDPPAGVQCLAKRVLIDLLDPKWGLAGKTMPEKIECLAFGPDLPDGRKLLLIGSDNDFQTGQDSLVYVFAVPAHELHDWNQEKLSKVTRSAGKE